MRIFILALTTLFSAGFCATVTPYIIGGTGAPVGSYPWNVDIIYPDGWCSGVLVSSDMILTSGHCINKSELGSYQFRIGGVNLSTGTVVNGAKAAYIATNFNPKATGTQVKNDAGLLQLKSAVTIAPVRISSVPIRANQHARIIGWGITQNSSTAPVSNTLQQADVTTVDLATCQATYLSQKQSQLPDAQEFCATSSNSTTQGICEGDSGGPLLMNEGNDWVLYGIASGGVSYCMQPGQPGYFENVSFYAGLFQNNTVEKIPQENVEFRQSALLLGH